MIILAQIFSILALAEEPVVPYQAVELGNNRISVSYPHLIDTNFLAHYVNGLLEKDARELFTLCLKQDDGESQSDIIPVYSTDTAVSFFGRILKTNGCIFGSLKYRTRTFLLQDGVVKEVTLDDLLVPGWRNVLLPMVEECLRSFRYGYYKYADASWVKFLPEHLDAFLLTSQGIVLVLQNYIVGGVNDEPAAVLIPYDQIALLVQKDGLLPPIIGSNFSADFPQVMGKAEQFLE